MITLNLTEDEIRQLSYERNSIHSPKILNRLLVLRCKSLGLEHQLIAKICDIHPNSVTNYLKMYNEGGINAILTTHYGKNESLLDKETEVKTYFVTNNVASVKAALNYIQKVTQIKCGLTCVRNFLHRIGLKPRKTGHIPGKADSATQEKFKDEILNPLIIKAYSGEIELLFMDAAHFVLGVFLSTIWSVKRVFIKSPAGRQRMNVLGALNIRSLNISTFTNNEYIDAISIAVFLKQLREEYLDKSLFIVLDNARYQHCKYIKSLAEENNITLVFLPPYSPNLNLIERVWKLVKKKALNSIYYDSFEKFTSAISKCLADCNSIYHTELKTLCTPKFQRF